MKDAIIETKDLTFSYPADEGAEPALVLKGRGPDHREGLLRGGAGPQRLRQVHPGQDLQRHPAALRGPRVCGGMDTQDENQLLAIRSTVGMVFQNPDNQIVANVVEEDVAFARRTGRPQSGDPPAGG